MTKLQVLGVYLISAIGLSEAHEYGHGIPRVMGHHIARTHKSHQHKRAVETSVPIETKLRIRDNTSDKCGPGFGSCAAGYCCSAEYVLLDLKGLRTN